MGDWLLGNFGLAGIQFENWVLVVVFIAVVISVAAWWISRNHPEFDLVAPAADQRRSGLRSWRFLRWPIAITVALAVI